MRAQLAQPDEHLLTPEAYDQLFSMHGLTMIFLFVTPMLSGFGNYLVPLMIGARDMAFPRLNAFGYWVFLGAGLLMYGGLLLGTAPDNGWFNYAPLSLPSYSPGTNIDFYAVGLVFLGISTTAGAINFIVTIFKLRAPGMSLDRLPLFCWAILATSFSIVFAIPSLTAACLLLFLQRNFGFHFFDTAGRVATRSSGSTCSGSSGTPTSTSSSCPRSGSSRRSCRRSRDGRWSATR